MNNSQKAVIVTGAAKGIGLATALKFATGNYCVTLVDNDSNGLMSAREHFRGVNPENLIFLDGDLSDPQFMKKVVEDTITKWARIDVLVNNAAWRTIETMRTINMDVWEQTIKVCLTAPAFMSKWCAEKMEQIKQPGVIINISSMMSDRAAGNSPAYIASKGALESLTKELAVTYGRSGIRVVNVNPGVIDTAMGSDYTDAAGNNISDQLTQSLLNATPLERGGKPEEVADAIYWLSSDSASFITGTSLLIDGGFTHNLTDYTMKKLQFPKEY